MSWLGVVFLSLLGVACVAVVYYVPLILVLAGVFTVWSLELNHINEHRLARLAAGREGESICTFARAFDRRAVDTWVIRAAFEELQPYCKFGRGVLPLRATDHLEAVLGIDPEDLEDVADEVAFRTGRSLDGCEENPYYGKVETVADLVLFFMAQPSERAA